MSDGGATVTDDAQTRSTAEVAAWPGVPSPAELTHVVALDGPAGTGKSSVARGVARQLGWRFVDTGATYRAATIAVLRAGIDPADAAAVRSVVEAVCIELVTDPIRPRVHLDGEDVSDLVRSADVTAQVSAVSAVPAVRRLLIAVQRDATGTTGAVVEGRDIATVVAPQAELKVYLDARPDVRAHRRAAELPESLLGTTAVAASLARRDGLDSQTNILAVSEGAVHLDTSELTLDQVIDQIVGLVVALERDR